MDSYLERKIAIDVVFCVDATESVTDSVAPGCSVLDLAKKKIISIYEDLSNAREKKGKSGILQFRVRLIAFRDYLADGERAMLVSDFFQLPQQSAEFEACVNSIHADGGGDVPEDGLEALAYAIRSNWTTEGTFRRHIIVLWTDAAPHALGFGKDAQHYPKGMASDIEVLTEWWYAMGNREKRLVLFAPDESYWQYICDNWDLTWHVPLCADHPLSDQGYERILEALV